MKKIVKSMKKIGKSMKKTGKIVKKMGKSMKSVKSGKNGSCKVLKKIDSSPQFLESHKKLLVCADDKCKEFLDKDIEITEKCLDKLDSMKIHKLSDERRMKVENDCYTKLKLVPNVMDKNTCLTKKCSKELNTFREFPLSEHNPEAIHDYTNFTREKYRLEKKRETILPELKEVKKLEAKRILYENAIDNCKNESGKKKIKVQMSKLDSQIAKFYVK